MSKKLWITGYFLIIIAALSFVAYKAVSVDPLFHFHAPDTEHYFYPLNNQRSQNNGITRNFAYGGLITGTSMTENFKTSEAEAIFGMDFIKVPYAGGSYYEINENLRVSASHNENLRIVIRGLDMEKFMEDTNVMRVDLGKYPTYLYDDNPLNDVEYIFNRDVIFSRIYPMEKARKEPGFQPGITSFDSYSTWMGKFSYGPKAVYADRTAVMEQVSAGNLTEREAEIVRANIRQNVTALADEYPDVTFYCFFTPYSAVWWQKLLDDGKLDKQIECERIVIEEILGHRNTRLYSFNTLYALTTDLNHYKDAKHYGEWINSAMLRYMHDGEYLLTAENYEAYLEEEAGFYSTYDYAALTEEENFEQDDRAAALLP
ncbi:MAG: hypothetical protein IJV41_03080 [Oscillospiraceae bacterium]|nr:hypothetical protein [Oscillospiraceae bacterium]